VSGTNPLLIIGQNTNVIWKNSLSGFHPSLPYLKRKIKKQRSGNKTGQVPQASEQEKRLFG